MSSRFFPVDETPDGSFRPAADHPETLCSALKAQLFSRGANGVGIVRHSPLRAICDAPDVSRELPHHHPVEELARRLEEKAVRAVWSGTTWLDASEISVRTAQPLSEVEQQLSVWEEERGLFSLHRDGVQLYPLYAFAEDFTPLPVVAEILVILGQHSCDWIAGWFESTSGSLGGSRPRELVRAEPVLVIAAAKAAYEGEEYCG